MAILGRDKRTATASPLLRGVRRSRGVCIVNSIQKVHIVFSGIDNRTATASPLLRGVRRSRGVCIVNPIQKVHIIKGLLQCMLAPPALYIPRHCRGTPFERGRCRRDACTVICILNPATSTLIILMHRQSDCHRESPLERGTAKPGGMYRKPNTKSPYLKRIIAMYAGSASVIHTPPLSWHPFRKGTLPL